MDGALQSAVTVEAGASLAGTGVIDGAVTIESGGTLAAGASPGVLATGDLTLAAGATFEAELGGTAAGQFDRVNVTGTVDLGGASLDIVLYGGFSPLVGASFLLIDNDGTADAVVGAFDGFADDVRVQLGGLYYAVDYNGGDGNDVVLTVLAAPVPPTSGPPPSFEPTPGDDRLNLSDSQLYFDADEGDDYVMGGAGNNTILGGEGNDSLFGGAGDDVLSGGSGSNYLRGGEGQDSLTGGDEFDDLHGGVGDDTIRGGGGGDWVVGGQGRDVLFGEAGDDVVLGNLGEDTLDGGDGNDIVRGGQGDDSVAGGAGDDWLSGDRGSDTITGGFGADTFHSWGDAGLDLVTDFNAADGDRVNLLAGTMWTAAQVGADTVINMAGGSKLVLQNVTLAGLPDGWIVGA